MFKSLDHIPQIFEKDNLRMVIVESCNGYKELYGYKNGELIFYSDNEVEGFFHETEPFFIEIMKKHVDERYSSTHEVKQRRMVLLHSYFNQFFKDCNSIIEEKEAAQEMVGAIRYKKYKDSSSITSYPIPSYPIPKETEN